MACVSAVQHQLATYSSEYKLLYINNAYQLCSLARYVRPLWRDMYVRHGVNVAQLWGGESNMLFTSAKADHYLLSICQG